MSAGLTAPLVAFAAVSIKNFDVQAKAEASLLTALKGRSDVQQRLIQQAKDLQKTTLFGDEETIAAQTMLATMGLSEEAILKLTPAIQDMAVAKKMGLVQAADLVAKSVGSSTNALSRYGITITGAVGSTERLDTLTNHIKSPRFLEEEIKKAIVVFLEDYEIETTKLDRLERMIMDVNNKMINKMYGNLLETTEEE